MEQLIINTSKDKLDLDFITEFISNSYWAKGRTAAEMQTCIDNSLNFGVYLNNRQIGYARVVTDYFQFAYIMDLFIAREYRGKGYAKELMNFMLEFEPLKNIKVWRLSTTDAHGLYKLFGFDKLEKPEAMMELKR